MYGSLTLNLGYFYLLFFPKHRDSLLCEDGFTKEAFFRVFSGSPCARADRGGPKAWEFPVFLIFLGQGAEFFFPFFHGFPFNKCMSDAGLDTPCPYLCSIFLTLLFLSEPRKNGY